MGVTIISVPKTREAMYRLDYDECQDDDLLEIYFDNEESEVIWKSGLWTAVNKELDLLIDTFEEEEIFFDMIDKLIIILEVYRERLDFTIYEKLREIFLAAKLYETEVYIVM